MPDTTIRTINLPPASKSGQPKPVESEGHFVIVGANGSGKTKFGRWVEFSGAAGKPTLRITAQRALHMPESATPGDRDKIERRFLWGHESYSEANRINRYNSKPDTFMLDNFTSLMELLFTDSYQVA